MIKKNENGKGGNNKMEHSGEKSRGADRNKKKFNSKKEMVRNVEGARKPDGTRSEKNIKDKKRETLPKDKHESVFSGKKGVLRKGESLHEAETIKKAVRDVDAGKKGAMKQGRTTAKAEVVGKDGTLRKNGTFGKVEKSGKAEKSGNTACPVFNVCGGCQLLDVPYDKQLAQKKKMLKDLLKGICPVKGMVGMEQPFYYRNKVHAVFTHIKGNPISGVYKADSHTVVPVERCLIEDQQAGEIIGTIRGMLKSFKIRTFDEDTGYGLLRHVLVRKGFATGQIMVVLVTASPVFPSKKNFVKALRDKHPEITTIIQNINNRDTSMVLGDREHVLYGRGFIEDVLLGCTFRISSKSFYQVNPIQTEKLYNLAIEKAGLTGKETVIDAYCGIGTIGIIASKRAGKVIGVELNQDAVRDAVNNAKCNGISNIQFYCNDAGTFMRNMASLGETVDVVFMDPPRSGSTEEFMDSVAAMRPDRVVYISCGPETLVRDLVYFRKLGYVAKEAWGMDLFAMTKHCESIVLLQRRG